MKPTPIITQETEDGLDFTVVIADLKSDDPYIARDFLLPGLCKIILNVDRVKRVHYFRNGVEMSKEKILQDERIKQLNR